MAASAVNERVETSDVQGLVLQGYGKLRAAAYVVLEITDGKAARKWLRGVLPEVGPCGTFRRRRHRRPDRGAALSEQAFPIAPIRCRFCR